MKFILGRIWVMWAGIFFALFFLLLYPLFLIFLTHRKLYPTAHFLRRIWGTLSCVTALYIPYVTREGKLPKNRRIIYTPNHVSHLDILATGSFLPGFNFFMGKAELTKIPLFNIWFKTLDVPVIREKMRTSHQAFVAAAKKFESGIDMIIFPEGKIPDSAPKMIPLKNGAFKLAIENGALIVPVTIPYNKKRLNVFNWTASPGLMQIHIHRPIDTVGLTLDDADALKEQVLHIIENKLISFGINTA